MKIRHDNLSLSDIVSKLSDEFNMAKISEDEDKEKKFNEATGTYVVCNKSIKKS